VAAGKQKLFHVMKYIISFLEWKGAYSHCTNNKEPLPYRYVDITSFLLL